MLCYVITLHCYQILSILVKIWQRYRKNNRCPFLFGNTAVTVCTMHWVPIAMRSKFKYVKYNIKKTCVTYFNHIAIYLAKWEIFYNIGPIQKITHISSKVKLPIHENSHLIYSYYSIQRHMRPMLWPVLYCSTCFSLMFKKFCFHLN